MQGNKHKANLVLAGTTAGYLMAVPFQDNLIGGLLASGLGAAMVGGAADWFAVNALFRSPFGISFKTAVIPNSRERIIHDLVDMVENRLLSKENIQRKINSYDMTGLLFTFLEEGGKEDIVQAIPLLLRDFILRMRPKELGELLAEIVKENAQHLARVAASIIVWSNEQGYTEKILSFLLREAQKLVQSQAMYNILYDFIEAARKTYANERTERKLADWLLTEGGYTPERLAMLAQTKLDNFLGEINQPKSLLRAEILHNIQIFSDNLLTDTLWQEKLSLIIKELGKAEAIKRAAGYMRREASHAAEGVLIDTLNEGVESLSLYIKQNQVIYQAVDSYLKQALLLIIKKYHSKIGILVAGSLKKYTALELAELVEHKVSDDLQMIRLNGSMVGALTGILIFLVTYGW